jgi:hypothetical protein
METGYTTCPFKRDSKVAGCVKDSQFICEKDDFLACHLYYKNLYEQEKKSNMYMYQLTRNVIDVFRERGEEITAIADKYDEMIDRCYDER